MEIRKPDTSHISEHGVFIEARDLSKRFGDIVAVERVSFQVRQGELFGFLGPNGAGKSTTINMLTGLARPDGGEIRIGGLECTANPKAAQHLIGVVPDESNLYPELSGFDNLCFCASLYGMRRDRRRARARELLETFGLQEAATRKFAGYSRGMKRRLTIAAGIIHNPRVLFLDEPTTGIDVASARHVRQLIAELHRAGTTIFLTTHHIEEAERLCERIAFIVRGRIIEIDTLANLLRPVRERYFMDISFSNPAPDASSLLQAAFPRFHFHPLSPGTVRIDAPEPIPVSPLARCLDERGIDLREARQVRQSLEDVFVRLTGIGAETMGGVGAKAEKGS